MLYYLRLSARREVAFVLWVAVDLAGPRIGQVLPNDAVSCLDVRPVYSEINTTRRSPYETVYGTHRLHTPHCVYEDVMRPSNGRSNIICF